MNPLLAATILVAGAAGATLRYLVTGLTSRAGYDLMRSPLPYPVLIVNAVGSLVAGSAAGLARSAALSADAQVIIITGLAGGLTTFSTLSVETLQLISAGRHAAATASVSANLVGGIVLAALGYAVASAL